MATNLGYKGVRTVNDNTIYSDSYVFNTTDVDFFKSTQSGSYINIVARETDSTPNAEYAITKEVSVSPSTTYGLTLSENAYPEGDWYLGALASENDYKVQLLESYSDTFSANKTTDLFGYADLLSNSLQTKHTTFTTDAQTRKIKLKFYCYVNFAIHSSDGFAVFNISDILIDKEPTERPWTPNKNEEDYGSIQITRSDLKIFDNGNTEVLTKINKGGVQTNALTIGETDIIDLIYPVGSIYMSVRSTSPAILFGGTWSAWGTGRVPVGIDTSQTEFDTVEETGGAKTVTLTTKNYRHNTWQASTWTGGAVAAVINGGGSAYGLDLYSYQNANEDTGTGNTAHNNLQPYITCYMWKRTA